MVWVRGDSAAAARASSTQPATCTCYVLEGWTGRGERTVGWNGRGKIPAGAVWSSSRRPRCSGVALGAVLGATRRPALPMRKGRRRHCGHTPRTRYVLWWVTPARRGGQASDGDARVGVSLHLAEAVPRANTPRRSNKADPLRPSAGLVGGRLRPAGRCLAGASRRAFRGGGRCGSYFGVFEARNISLPFCAQVVQW